MDHEELVQGTQEWLNARAGSLGASRVAEVIAKTKTGWGASRANVMADLIVERLTGAPVADKFVNAAMVWGTEVEPQARAAYEFYKDVSVQQVGIVRHPSIAGTHASPDGLVGDDGLIEIKSPQTANHIETLVGRSIPAKYITQMMWQMACTGRRFCDFVSFDPRMPEPMQFYCQRVERDDAVIEELEKEVITFLNEIRAKITTLRKIYDPDMQPLDEAAELLMAG